MGIFYTILGHKIPQPLIVARRLTGPHSTRMIDMGGRIKFCITPVIESPTLYIATSLCLIGILYTIKYPMCGR
jgi:hypothetical protein